MVIVFKNSGRYCTKVRSYKNCIFLDSGVIAGSELATARFAYVSSVRSLSNLEIYHPCM